MQDCNDSLRNGALEISSHYDKLQQITALYRRIEAPPIPQRNLKIE